MKILPYLVFTFFISFTIPLQAKDSKWKIFVDLVTAVAGSAIYDLVQTDKEAASQSDTYNKLAKIEELKLDLQQFKGTEISAGEINEISELLNNLRSVVQETNKLPAELGARMSALEKRVIILEATTVSINKLIHDRGVDLVENRIVEPSFDCRRAIEPIELSICGSTELSYIDREMGDLYWDLRDGLVPSQSIAIKKDQLLWLKNRDITCGAYDQPCLLGVYRDRIGQLRGWAEN